ncbi:cyclophilin-like fold protein [Vibrio viridaestus]|uniref:cyclophilin-like fold protein n=1 Tax=Vibrio viridaestus TaxID=2487322 RepID=UPI001FB622D6|nr:cyclophilin-like fold protein [Vibrio viridaestus]
MSKVSLTLPLMVLAATLSIARFAWSEQVETEQILEKESSLDIRFIFDDKTVSATLENNEITRDFIEQLPLTFALEDYAQTEKIAYLPRKLITTNAPKGSKGMRGDISYYAPWGNLVVFYKDFGFANGLIHLGEINEGLERFTRGGNLTVTIEVAE